MGIITTGGPRTATFTLTLDHSELVAATVHWTTVDGTAIAGVDYTAVSGTATIPPGTTVITLTVPVAAPVANAIAKTFTVQLTAPTNCTLPVGITEVAACTIPPGVVVPPTPALPIASIATAIVTAVPAAPILTALSAGVGALANQFVDVVGNVVRLRGINWYGCDGTNLMPHGLYAGRSYTGMLDQMAGLGFNCVRLLFCDDFLHSTALIGGGVLAYVDPIANPDLQGLTPLAAVDKIIAYGASLGMRFILDQHRISATSISAADGGYGTDGWPAADPVGQTSYTVPGGSYTIANWTTTWMAMAAHYTTGQYATDPLKNAIVGFDPHNEPYRPTWGTWASMVETLANAVHSVAPAWMVFVEGVGASGSDVYWYGGELRDVATRPLSITHQNKVAYQAHDYGQSVSVQPWLASTIQAVATYPNNLEAVIDAHWGFIFKNNLAPVLVGEFGGKFGVDGAGHTDLTQVNAAFEIQWMQALTKYLNGGRNDGTSMISGAQQGISFTYFAINPESGDIGGLLQDDYATVQAVKMNLLLPLLT